MLFTHKSLTCKVCKCKCECCLPHNACHSTLNSRIRQIHLLVMGKNRWKKAWATVRVWYKWHRELPDMQKPHTANWSLELVGLTAAAEALVEKRPLLSTIFWREDGHTILIVLCGMSCTTTKHTKKLGTSFKKQKISLHQRKALPQAHRAIY